MFPPAHGGAEMFRTVLGREIADVDAEGREWGRSGSLISVDRLHRIAGVASTARAR